MCLCATHEYSTLARARAYNRAGLRRRAARRRPPIRPSRGPSLSVSKPMKGRPSTISASTRRASGVGGDSDQPFHARRCIMLYRDYRLAWDRQACRQPLRHNRSELSYPCPAHTRRVRPLPAVSRTCVEAALKISSTLFSIEKLRKRPVSAKTPQRSFLLHHRSKDRPTFRGVRSNR